MTSFLIKFALAGAVGFVLGRFAYHYLRFRCAQAREHARFRKAADAGLARHRRRPERASRVFSTRATGPVICYRN
jgi:hypothetical protein